MDSDDKVITNENALVVIAEELRNIRFCLERSLDADGVFDRIHTVLHDNLQTFGGDGEASIADHVAIIERDI